MKDIFGQEMNQDNEEQTNEYNATFHCTNCETVRVFMIPKGTSKKTFKSDLVCDNCGCSELE